jgi:hypothetical protein
MKKNAIVYGTNFGSDGIIICGIKRITFIHKSSDTEIVRRWYYKNIESISIEMEGNKAVIQFYHSGRRVVFSNLSSKAVIKIKDFLLENTFVISLGDLE